MMQVSSRIVSIWISLTIIVAWGCSQDVPNTIDASRDVEIADVDTHDTQADVNANDADSAPDFDADSGADADGEADPDVDVGFQKPTPDNITYGNGALSRTYSCDEACAEGVFFRESAGMRPHSIFSAGMKEVWLYEGEYLVLDSARTQSDGHWWLPGEFKVVALHEGRYLPIRYMEINDPEFPPMSEIESWPESDFTTVQTIYREPFVTFNSTFVIPPWAFPEKGTYNVQLLILPVWREYPDRRFLSERNSFIHRKNSELHKTFTIYYGSYDFQSHAEIEDRQNDALIWEDATPWGYVQELNLMFLAPPIDRFNWREFWWVWDAPPGGLTSELTFSEPIVTLDFYTVNGGLRYTHTTGQNLYYVLRNEEVIDMFLLEPPSIAGDDAVWEEERGVRLPITFELTEEMASYKIIVVPEPFQPQRDFPERMGNLPIASNALLMRYEPPQP